MSQKLYIVNSSYDGYDSYEIGYHLTRKGALRTIMRRKYYIWQMCRYVHDDSYDMPRMYITEGILSE